MTTPYHKEVLDEFNRRWPSTESYTNGKMQEDILQMLSQAESHAYRRVLVELESAQTAKECRHIVKSFILSLEQGESESV